ncbi:MAG: ABC transporter ATP-binding protein [Gammaproteobacteria bacterium]|nr:MAG: ABC transporter ATP-binding protein [Gammaproteobacteria bacterium]
MTAKPRPNEPRPEDYAAFDAELAGRSFEFRLLRRLLGWVRPHRRDAILSGILVIIGSLFAILMPVIIARVVIDGVLVADQPLTLPDFGMIGANELIMALTGFHPLAAACALYLLAALGWSLAMHGHRVLLARAALGALRDLRHDLFAHLQYRPAAFYDHVAVGRLTTRVSNDVEVLFQLLAGFGVLFGELVPFFVAAGIMLSVSLELTGVLGAMIPLVVIATALFRWRTRSVYREIRTSISRLNQNLAENISGMPVVQLHRREGRNLRDYKTINQDNRRHERRAVNLETLYGAFMDSLAPAALAAIVWFGGGAVLQEQISLGSMILFAQFVDMLFRPVVALGEQYNVLFRAMASTERIFQLLDWKQQIPEVDRPVDLPPRLSGRVRFEHASFGYFRDQPVLHDLDFELQPGETLAVVGPTGSGKSTLIRLLCRFYDLRDGRILVDGIDIREVDPRALRSRIGVVMQDFHVFAGSVRSNITLDDPKLDAAAAERAARMVNADAFITQLPQGYDTLLTERGQNLSQGQRQLLAFARVLAADPEVLILDEATASIDPETEVVIQNAVRTLTRDRSAIVIAHRLQTIEQADRILVLRHGRLEELGSHQELINAGGLYATLHALQFQE